MLSNNQTPFIPSYKKKLIQHEFNTPQKVFKQDLNPRATPFQKQYQQGFSTNRNQIYISNGVTKINEGQSSILSYSNQATSYSQDLQSSPRYQQKQASNQEQLQARMKKTDRTKYKTELCKNWIEVGVCRYEGKCQFAHGEDELVGKLPPSNSKYKSKTCTTFNEKLFCPYGKRCLFRHDDRQMDELFRYTYSFKLALIQDNYKEYQSLNHLNPEKIKTKRLSVFGNFTEMSTLEDNFNFQFEQEYYNEQYLKANKQSKLKNQSYNYNPMCSPESDLGEMCTDDEEINFSKAHQNLKKSNSTNSLAEKAQTFESDSKSQYSSNQSEGFYESDSIGEVESRQEIMKEKKSPFFINRKEVQLFIQ